MHCSITEAVISFICIISKKTLFIAGRFPIRIFSDVLDNSGKSKGQSPTGQEIISRTPGNCRHPSSQVPKRGTRTHRRRVITDTWTGDKKEHGPGKATHRLRNLGFASPFDLPKDPYFLLELFAIVLCRRIHFLSVKTLHYFRVITEPLKFYLQGNQEISSR